MKEEKLNMAAWEEWAQCVFMLVNGLVRRK